MAELNEDRYMNDVLNDEVWSELSIDQAEDLVRRHRSLTNRALANVKQEIFDARDAEAKRRLNRKRSSTVTFLDLLNQRWARIKAEARKRNIAESDTETRLQLAIVKSAIRDHRSVTMDKDSTEAQLDKADADLYAVLNKITGGMG